MKRYFTKEEDSVILKAYETGGTNAVQLKLTHRSKPMIYARATRLGVSNKTHDRSDGRTNENWSYEEKVLLRKIWATHHTDKVLEEFPNRSRSSIMKKVREMGLRKSRAARAKMEYEINDEVLKQIREQMFKLNIGMNDLERGINGAHGFIGNIFKPSHKPSLRIVRKVVEFMGGTLKVEWNE